MDIKFTSINADDRIIDWQFDSNEIIGIHALLGRDAVFSDLIILLGIDV